MKTKKAILLSAILLAASTLLATACKSTPQAEPGTPGPAPHAVTPPWFDEFPKDDNLIWGIGTAHQSSTDLSMTMAETRARASIARQMRILAQQMIIDYNEDAGRTGSQVNTSLQSAIDRQVTDMDLAGARPVNRWQAPDGAVWYRVEYNKAAAREQVANILKNEEAAFAAFKAKQALEYLDSQLAKPQKPVVVDDEAAAKN
jgi:hypothetical protein